jgi:hypothetical protein
MGLGGRVHSQTIYMAMGMWDNDVLDNDPSLRRRTAVKQVRVVVGQNEIVVRVSRG